MKLSFIIFSLLLNSIILIGQEAAYIPLLTEDKEWDVLSWKSSSFIQDQGAIRMYLGGDTLIGNKAYNIILAKNWYSIEYDFFAAPFGIREEERIVAFMREDTLEQKVYAISERYYSENETEELIYDFSLTLGDSLFWSEPQKNIVLDSIGLTYWSDDIQRRIFYFSDGDNLLWEGNNFYIEGIGGFAGILLPLQYQFEAGSNLICVTNNAGSLYSGYYFSNNCNANILSSLEAIPVKSSLNIYPNPFQEQLYIDYPKGVKWVRVLDLNGTILFQKQVKNDAKEIRFDLENLSNGIYFIQGISEKESFIERIIKSTTKH